MSRELTVVQPLSPGDHAPVFRRDPGVWLPPGRPAGPDAWRVEVGVGGLRRPVRCSVGSAWRSGATLWRRVHWDPLDTEADALPVARMLPVLDAELHLVGTTATPSLLLSGEIELPLGRVGEAVDTLLLGRVARATVAGFLADVAVQLPRATTPPASSLVG